MFFDRTMMPMSDHRWNSSGLLPTRGNPTGAVPWRTPPMSQPSFGGGNLNTSPVMPPGYVDPGRGGNLNTSPVMPPGYVETPRGWDPSQWDSSGLLPPSASAGSGGSVDMYGGQTQTPGFGSPPRQPMGPNPQTYGGAQGQNWQIAITQAQLANPNLSAYDRAGLEARLRAYQQGMTGQEAVQYQMQATQGLRPGMVTPEQRQARLAAAASGQPMAGNFTTGGPMDVASKSGGGKPMPGREWVPSGATDGPQQPYTGPQTGMAPGQGGMPPPDSNWYAPQPAQPPAQPGMPAPQPWQPGGQQPAIGGNINPFLQQQADYITDLMTRNLRENILPGIGDQAILAGGYGGSRQGIAEGRAIEGMGRDLGGTLGQMFLAGYEGDQNRAVAREGQNNAFYNAQRGLDLQQLGLGANLMGMGWGGLGNAGMNLWNLGQQQQMAPWQMVQQYLGALGMFSGLGGSSTQTTPGNPLLGALGGWQLAHNLLR